MLTGVAVRATEFANLLNLTLFTQLRKFAGAATSSAADVRPSAT